jgi:hypothetical protein
MRPDRHRREFLRNSIPVLFGYVGAGRPLPTGNRTAQHLASGKTSPRSYRGAQLSGNLRPS